MQATAGVHGIWLLNWLAPDVQQAKRIVGSVVLGRRQVSRLMNGR
ncbi:MAG TPA: hypothetical protein VHL31_07030 [Geminicoccus sp.]|nr:hypothetical protein [Geminicoccus sp.]HEX2526040.1 hypothetical protein [Geminicoccus sp.]